MKEEKVSKVLGIMMNVVIFLLIVSMVYFGYEQVRSEIPNENNCIEEESYYYRVEGFFIFSNKIETSMENSDGIDWRCIEWEEEPALSKSMLGQKLIHDKGMVKRE